MRTKPVARHLDHRLLLALGACICGGALLGCGASSLDTGWNSATSAANGGTPAAPDAAGSDALPFSGPHPAAAQPDSGSKPAANPIRDAGPADAAARRPDAQPSDAAASDARVAADSRPASDATVDAGTADRLDAALPNIDAGDGGSAIDVAPCPDGILFGDVSIQTSADIERLRGCYRVTGSVVITTRELVDLKGLEALSVIDGALRIAPSTAIANAVARRGPSLTDEWNPGDDPATSPPSSLTSLVGLERLHSVGRLEFVGITISSLRSLVALEQAPWVHLNYLTALQDLKGLEGLDWSTFIIKHSDALRTLEGLKQQPARVPELLHIEACAQLSSAGLEKLRDIDQLSLIELPALSTLSGLGGLETVGHTSGGGLNIGSCSGLHDLSGLSSLKSVAYLGLTANRNLQTLTGMSALSDPPHVVGLSDNPRLETLAGLMPATGTGPWSILSMVLTNLPGLRTLSGLNQLRHVDWFKIQTCDGLIDLSGLTQLADVGELWVEDCVNLQNLKGTEAIQKVTDGLFFTGNSRLPQCEVERLASRLQVAAGGENFLEGTCTP